MLTKKTAKRAPSARIYLVNGKRFKTWDSAAGYAVANAIRVHDSGQSIAIQTSVRGVIIETVDVTAARSIDPE